MNAITDRLILVTGAARSGKSDWAEQLARQSGSVIYVATAQVDPTDLEWQARIDRHRARRPAEWQTQHVPIALADAIRTAPDAACLLIDSIGTWLANLLEQNEPAWNATMQDFLNSLEQSPNRIILVAEEVGWGVVPAYPIGRCFRDRLGGLTRQVGAIAHPVYLVTAGHVLNLSHLGHPLPRT